MVPQGRQPFKGLGFRVCRKYVRGSHHHCCCQHAYLMFTAIRSCLARFTLIMLNDSLRILLFVDVTQNMTDFAMCKAAWSRIKGCYKGCGFF